MFIHFVSKRGQNLLVSVKDISFILQKGIFCELHVRGVEGHIDVEDDFSEICRKIEGIFHRVNNTDGDISGGTSQHDVIR